MGDVDRSNNIGIMLARLRLPPETIRQIVWEAEDEKLDIDKLGMVARMLPTHDEVSRIPKSSIWMLIAWQGREDQTL